MDRVLGAKAEVAMLKRIVALLYSLASLAERAACRSLAIRCVALGFLRLAESVAREMVISDSHRFDAASGQATAPRIGCSADDAMRLAQRFRELAFMLESLAAIVLVAGGRIFRCQMLRGLLRAVQTMGFWRLPLGWPGLGPVLQPDTS